MRNNEYTATPNWFKQESTDSQASVYQTNYYLTGSTSSGSGMSSINLYNKYIINTYRLTVDDLFIPNTAIIAVDSELPEGQEPPEDFVSEVGNNVEATNWHTSYLISVVSGTNLIANLKANSNRYGIVFYDEYNQPISGYTPIVDELATIPVPENARYFRCCHYIEPVVESVEEPVEPTYEFYIEYTGMGNYEDSDLNTAYGGIFENFTNVNSSVPEGINTKQLSASGLNLIFQQPLSCTVDKSNNIKIGLDKVFTDSKVQDLWKLIEDEQGNKYIITDYNVVGKGGITAYYNDDLNPGGDGGLGGGGSIVNIQIIGEGNVLSDVTLSEDKSLLTFTKSKIEEQDLWKLIEDEQGNRYIVTDYNIVGRGGITAYYDGDLTPGSGGGLGGGTILDIEIKGEGNALFNAYLNEDKSILNFDRGYLMDLTTEQTSTALKTFTEGIKIGDTLIKVIDGVLTLDCSLAVTGGITAYALGEQIASSIMDAIICDNTTITVVDGKLTVIGGTGGASNWDELEGKPSWITDTKPTYAWGEITQKPTISLGNYLSGHVSLNGSSNVTLNATVIGLTSQGNKTSISGTTMPAEGLRLYNVYKNGYPCAYGNLISVKGQGAGELLLEWTEGSTLGHIRYRSKRDIHESGWSSWGTVAFTTDNVASATKLKTARTIWGQSFDGTKNITGTFLYSDEATLRIYSDYNPTFPSAYGKGTACIQSCFDSQDPESSDYVTKYPNRSVLSLQPRGGYVGIGTTSPSYKLEVNGSTSTTNLYINGIQLHKTADGVITLEGNLAVTGGITQFAVNEVSSSTIMDGVAADEVTLTKSNGVLKIKNAGSGSSFDKTAMWSALAGATNEQINETHLTTALNDYLLKSQYTAQDVLNKIKTVDGSGSGLDADLLEGWHRNDLPRTYNNSKTYGCQFATGGTDNSWKKIFALSVPTTGSYKGCTVKGTIYYAFGNHAQLYNTTVPFEVIFTLDGESHTGHFVKLYLPKYFLYDVIRVVKVSDYSYEIQVRQYSSYNSGYIYYQFQTYSSTGTGYNSLQTASNGTVICSISNVAEMQEDTVYNAIKLKTARTIWGQNFDGTANVNGNISNTQAIKSKDGVWLDLYGNNGIAFYTANTVRGCFSNSGNFGIGTTSPSYKLHVLGDSYFESSLSVYSSGNHPYNPTVYVLNSNLTNNNIVSLIIGNSCSSKNSGYLGFSYNSNNSNDNYLTLGVYSVNKVLNITGAGYVGIGTTSPTTKLDVVGSARIGNSRKIYIGDYGGGDAGIYNEGTNWFRINSKGNINISANISTTNNDTTYQLLLNTNGNVGIGTASPSAKLHVVGDILSTGGITCYSSDERAKTILEELNLSLKEIAESPIVRFKWNDWKIKDDGKTHIGGIAQYVQKILPETILEADGALHMDYATTGYIFSVQTARHLQSYETKTDKEIKKLKNRITFLEKQLKKLGYEEVDIMAD